MDPTQTISVALCTFNGAQFLREQLDSVLGQDYPCFEVVAVDDGSVDGTFEILKEYQRGDSRLIVHRNEKNLGFTKNFERAIGMCSGELIAPCDQDDIWLPSKLRKLVESLGRSDLVYCNSELVDEHGRSLGRTIGSRLNMYQGSDPAFLVFDNCVSGHALLCTRSLVERAIPFPPGLFYDWWIAFVAASTGRIEYRNECLVKFRRHGAAQTGNGKEKNKRERVHPINKIRRQMNWLDAIRKVPSPRQGLLVRLHELMNCWHHQYFSPGLVVTLFLHRNAFFFIAKGSWQKRLLAPLRYIWGLKLKKFVKPKMYATEPGNGDGNHPARFV